MSRKRGRTAIVSGKGSSAYLRQFSALKPASSITITSFALFFAFGMLNLAVGFSGEGFSGLSGRADATTAGAGFAEDDF